MSEKKVDRRKTVIVELEDGVLIDGALTKSISVRRPNVGDLEAYSEAEGSTMKRDMILAARLSGLTIEELRTMDAGDYSKVAEQIVAFTAGAGSK